MEQKLLPTKAKTIYKRKQEITNPKYQQKYSLEITSVSYANMELNGKIHSSNNIPLRFFSDGLEAVIEEIERISNPNRLCGKLVDYEQKEVITFHYIL